MTVNIYCRDAERQRHRQTQGVSESEMSDSEMRERDESESEMRKRAMRNSEMRAR